MKKRGVSLQHPTPQGHQYCDKIVLWLLYNFLLLPYKLWLAFKTFTTTHSKQSDTEQIATGTIATRPYCAFSTLSLVWFLSLQSSFQVVIQSYSFLPEREHCLATPNDTTWQTSVKLCVFYVCCSWPLWKFLWFESYDTELKTIKKKIDFINFQKYFKI